jgi:DNA-binding NarL/FixJ family response regulator
VRTLARGQALLPASAFRRLLGGLRRGSPRHTDLALRLEGLTDRELEVVMLAAKGLSNSEIAARLWITPGDSQTHVSRAMTKLQARTRAELVVSAYETGLVLP